MIGRSRQRCIEKPSGPTGKVVAMNSVTSGKMPGRAAALVAAFLALVLSGCATVTKQAYNRSAHPDIKVVAVIEQAPATEYAVVNFGHVGNAFGLIGAAVAAADQQSKTKDFSEAAKARGFDLTGEFRTQLVKAIESRGYRVKLVKVERPKGGFVENYANLDPEADAYIDAVASGGYVCASATSDYFPSLLVNVRVVKRASKEIVYKEMISYGYEFKYGQPIQITADPKYRFADHAALMANVPLAVDGLRDGIPKVIAQLERDLSK
jgi:hypothetical protein